MGTCRVWYAYGTIPSFVFSIVGLSATPNGSRGVSFGTLKGFGLKMSINEDIPLFRSIFDHFGTFGTGGTFLAIFQKKRNISPFRSFLAHILHTECPGVGVSWILKVWGSTKSICPC